MLSSTVRHTTTSDSWSDVMRRPMQSDYKPTHMLQCDAVHMVRFCFALYKIRSVGLQADAYGTMVRCDAAHTGVHVAVERHSEPTRNRTGAKRYSNLFNRFCKV